MVLLLFGGRLWLVGGFAGVGLLWASPRWRWPDKLLGTLVWPGGLFGLVVAVFAWSLGSAPSGCDPPVACWGLAFGPTPSTVMTVRVVLALVQLAIAAWLVYRAHRRAREPLTPSSQQVSGPAQGRSGYC